LLLQLYEITLSKFVISTSFIEDQALKKTNLFNRIFEMLVENGADVNAQNDSLKTALMIAAFYGKF